MDNLEDPLAEVADTELIQIANNQGFEGSGACSRGIVMAFLVGEGVTRPKMDPVHHVRLLIHEFILAHYETVRGQLSCDTDCATCPEGMVASCWSKNKSIVD